MANKKQMFIDGEIVAVGLQNIDKDDNDLAIVFDSDETEFTIYVDGYEFIEWFNKDMIKEIKYNLNKHIKKL